MCKGRVDRLHLRAQHSKAKLPAWISWHGLLQVLSGLNLGNNFSGCFGKGCWSPGTTTASWANHGILALGFGFKFSMFLGDGGGEGGAWKMCGGECGGDGGQLDPPTVDGPEEDEGWLVPVRDCCNWWSGTTPKGWSCSSGVDSVWWVHRCLIYGRGISVGWIPVRFE